ncbi:MAG: rhamnulokinase [Ruminococcaceae bacterium]|nr:rhamnulokinase [Oscillospiraceae bacterium]
MVSYCLAVDIGASSGRHILGEVKNGKIFTEEIYRFENGMINSDEGLLWDIKSLTENVISGIEKCKELGKIPDTVAIDTWGVDYVLLDKDKKEIMPAFAYRNSRTAGVPEKVFGLMSKEEIYKKTGIQKQDYNTIYQLFCEKESGRLESAEYFLMIPEYLSFKLTGEIKNEYTNATTTGLVNAEDKTWDTELLNALGLKNSIFGNLSLPGEYIGNFTPEIKNRVGFDAKVVFAPSHDTAAAVAACPVDENTMFISSGTWSLIGTENLSPETGANAMEANFTNEGGIDYRFRFLKNIMGMWLFQNIRKNLDKKYTYDEMMEMAQNSTFTEKIDPTNSAFLAPENMIDAVNEYLGKPELALGDTLSSVYHSLANSYALAVKELEEITGKEINRIAIVGGGCKDKYLNELTKKYTGKRVTAGPVECTAIGNLLAQFMFLDKELNLAKARELVINTFDIKEI